MKGYKKDKRKKVYIAYVSVDDEVLMPNEAFPSFDSAEQDLEAFLVEVAHNYGVQYEDPDSDGREDFEDTLFQRGVHSWDVREVFV